MGVVRVRTAPIIFVMVPVLYFLREKYYRKIMCNISQTGSVDLLEISFFYLLKARNNNVIFAIFYLESIILDKPCGQVMFRRGL